MKLDKKSEVTTFQSIGLVVLDLPKKTLVLLRMQEDRVQSNADIAKTHPSSRLGWKVYLPIISKASG